MEDKRPAPVAEEQPNKPKKPRSRALRRVLAALLTVLLVILAVLVFVYRDALTEEGLRKTLGHSVSDPAPAREAFTYETGAEQVFASVGDGLAVASSSSLQLLNAAGETVFKRVVSYDLPAVFSASDRALFCDLGGTGCVVAGLNGETVVEVAPAGEILTADMNDAGWFVLVTAEAGYKGRASVYNSAGELQYEWWSGGGYVLRACLSPDNRTLAVLSVEKDGSVLRSFSLRSETALWEQRFPETLYFDLHYLSGAVCAVSEEGLLFVSSEGEVQGEYKLNGSYLLDYNFGSRSFAAVLVSNYRSGGGGTLLTLDDRGAVLGTAPLDRDVTSLSACGRQLLVMTGGGVYLFSSDLVQQAANETLMTAKAAVLRPKGDILLLSAYAAERFGF